MDAFAHKHRCQFDPNLVEKTEVEALLSDVGPSHTNPQR
jgi:hypothetical protein